MGRRNSFEYVAWVSTLRSQLGSYLCVALSAQYLSALMPAQASSDDSRLAFPQVLWCWSL